MLSISMAYNAISFKESKETLKNRIWYGIFSETDTFFRDQIFPKPKLRLFSDTKFSETDTFFRIPNFSKPKSSKIWQKSRDRDLN